MTGLTAQICGWPGSIDFGFSHVPNGGLACIQCPEANFYIVQVDKLLAAQWKQVKNPDHETALSAAWTYINETVPRIYREKLSLSENFIAALRLANEKAFHQMTIVLMTKTDLSSIIGGVAITRVDNGDQKMPMEIEYAELNRGEAISFPEALPTQRVELARVTMQNPLSPVVERPTLRHLFLCTMRLLWLHRRPPPAYVYSPRSPLTRWERFGAKFEVVTSLPNELVGEQDCVIAVLR